MWVNGLALGITCFLAAKLLFLDVQRLRSCGGAGGCTPSFRNNIMSKDVSTSLSYPDIDVVYTWVNGKRRQFGLSFSFKFLSF